MTVDTSDRETFTDKDKVEVLLHEYDGLRREIVARTNAGHQLLAVGAVLFVWIVSNISGIFVHV